jgi:competence protein ComEC
MMRIIYILGGLFILLVGYTIYQYFSLQDDKLHVIFCNVGQGDAVLIKTPKNKYILFDSGPDKKVTHCLGRHMPYWQHSIALFILSHPHADHYFGLYYLLDSYEIGSFVTENIGSNSRSYKEIMKKLAEHKTIQSTVTAGASMSVDTIRLDILSPSDSYLESKTQIGNISESNENVSVMVHISYDNFDILLTGDSPVGTIKEHSNFLPAGLEVFQSPHHGSRTGIDASLLELLTPHIAVISVGTKNMYGHPHKEVLDIYKKNNISVLRTDLNGDVEIVSDGKMWEVRE